LKTWKKPGFDGEHVPEGGKKKDGAMHELFAFTIISAKIQSFVNMHRWFANAPGDCFLTGI
jgi:hypothetical protein